MPQIRLLSLLLVIGIGTTFAPASAQQYTESSDLTAVAFNLVAYESVKAELDLSRQQIADIETIQKEFFAAVPPGSESATVQMTTGERREWESKRERLIRNRDREYRARLEGVLTDTQEQRLREILVQTVVTTLGPAGVVHVEIAGELEVTEAQKTMLTHIIAEWVETTGQIDRRNPRTADVWDKQAQAKADAAADAVLTDVQRRKLRRMQGAPFQIPWRTAPVIESE